MFFELFSRDFQGADAVSGTPLACLLFVGFSILVVHVCQRLVEQTALAVEELERSAYFARNAFCIGALVWCLDALGLFLYRDMAPMGVRLAPTLFSMLIMILACRATIPFLVSTRGKGRILGAGVLLSLGMLAGHFVQISALGHPSGEIRWWAVGLSCLIANLQSDPDRQSLIHHLCAMARDLRVGVTVEGIETEGDLAMVKVHGADWAQGYFLARPMAAQAVPRWLRAFDPIAEAATTPVMEPITLGG